MSIRILIKATGVNSIDLAWPKSVFLQLTGTPQQVTWPIGIVSTANINVSLT